MARLYYKWSEDAKELHWEDRSESGQPINAGTISADHPDVLNFLSQGNEIILLEVGEPTDTDTAPAPSGLYPITYNEDGTFTQTI